MGSIVIIIVLIYLFLFSAIGKKSRQNKSSAAYRSPAGKRRAEDDPAGQAAAVQTTQEEKISSRGKTPSAPMDYSGHSANPFRRKYTGPEACSNEHEKCSHISTYGKFKDFEDREHDWLAEQMAEERKIQSRMRY